MKKNKDENVIKYKRPFSINIGIIIFLMIIVYLVYSIFAYFTKKSVAEYEVVQGSIASNNIYTALAIRDETVVYADRAGYVNYYVSDDSKVSVHDLIYSIDSDGAIFNAMKSEAKEEGLSSDSFSDIINSVEDYMTEYNSINYKDVSRYKNDLSSQINQEVNNQAMVTMADQITEASNNNSFYEGYTQSPGLVLYYIDGYEGITTDSYTEDNLKQLNYVKTNLNANQQVEAGSPLYKLVTNEEWHLIFEISKDMADTLADKSSVKIRFCQDNFTSSYSFTISQKDGNYYLDLKLLKGLVRYANERFINVELIISEDTGLKIPNSSITTKNFYKIPIEYFGKGGNSNELGILVKAKDSETDQFTFVAPTIYYEEEDQYYYVDSEFVDDGDIIQMMGDATKTYTVGQDIGTLTGVYNINKGYAVFKQINIIYQNKEYTIVEPKTDYGIALYDHIALDASSLKENELISE